MRKDVEAVCSKVAICTLIGALMRWPHFNIFKEKCWQTLLKLVKANEDRCQIGSHSWLQWKILQLNILINNNNKFESITFNLFNNRLNYFLSYLSLSYLETMSDKDTRLAYDEALMAYRFFKLSILEKILTIRTQWTL